MGSLAYERIIVDELTTLQDLRNTVVRVISWASSLDAHSRHISLAELHKTVDEFRRNAQRTHILLTEFGASILPNDRVRHAELNRYSAALHSLVLEVDQSMRSHLQTEESDLIERRRTRVSPIDETADSFARSPTVSLGLPTTI